MVRVSSMRWHHWECGGLVLGSIAKPWLGRQAPSQKRGHELEDSRLSGGVVDQRGNSILRDGQPHPHMKIVISISA